MIPITIPDSPAIDSPTDKPAPIARIMNLDVEGAFLFGDQIDILNSAIREADQVSGELPRQTRVLACRSLISLTEVRQPPITQGISFDDLELIITQLISWHQEVKKRCDTQDREDEALLHDLEEDLYYSFNDLIPIGFHFFQAAFENTLLPQINAFKEESHLPPALSNDKLNILRDLAQDLLGVDTEYLGITPAIQASFDAESFDFLLGLIEQFSGSSSITQAYIKGLEDSKPSQLHIVDRDLSHFADMRDLIASIGESVESLSLHNCKINEEGVVALCHLLRTSPKLRELDLSNNHIDTIPAIDLIEATVRGQNRLQRLILSNNAISDAALEALLATVNENQTLQEVDISENPIRLQGPLGNELREAIEKITASHPSLRRIIV